MKIIMNNTDITRELAPYNGEYVTLELSCGKAKKKWGGTLTVIPDAVPYNPLTDTDCGTDAMLGRGI